MTLNKQSLFTIAGVIGALVGAYEMSGHLASAFTIGANVSGAVVSRPVDRTLSTPSDPPCSDYLIVRVTALGDYESATATYPTENSVTTWANSHAISIATVQLNYPNTSVLGSIAASALTSYNTGEAQGVVNLTKFLDEQEIFCGYQAIMLIGYSEGAQVIGDTLLSTSHLSWAARSAIEKVVLFGDPVLNRQSSVAQVMYTPSALWPQNEGILGPRSTDFSNSYRNEILDLCAANDPVCSGLSQSTTIDISQAYNHTTSYQQANNTNRAASWLIGGIEYAPSPSPTP